MSDPVCLGIDVARDDLEVAVYPTDEGWRVPNTPAGHARLIPLGADPPPRPPGAGSHGRLRAGRGRGPVRGRAAGGREQSAPGARLRPQPQHPGQDGPRGRAGAGALRGRGPTAAPPAPLGRQSRTARPGHPPAPTPDGSGRRAAAAPAGVARGPGRHRCPTWPGSPSA